MNNPQTENPFATAIKWLAFAIMATPLIVSSSTLFPYVFGKAIAFQSLVEIMLVCYAWLIFSDYRKTGRFNYLPRLNYLTWAIIIFFIILTLSTIFSVDRSYSFWSKQERMDGLFNLAHFFFFFIILTGALKDKKSLFQIFDVSLAVGFIICLHAIGQIMGKFFLPYGERLTATLGNAAFLATYLIFNIFFALLLLINRKNLWLKAWYVFMILLQIVILFLSYTRGAIFGFIAGLIIFSFLFVVFSKKNKYKKYALGLFFVILLLGISLFAARNANIVKNNRLLYRLTDLSLKQGTGLIRITSWKIGINAFFEKPLLGWGQENYYVAFNKHLNPVFFSYSGETFDRAHNKIVDILVMNGFLGLLAYLFVFISAFLVLWPKRKKMFATSLILVALLAAYFVQNLFLFDMPVSYLMFFLFLSSINIIFIEQSKPEPMAPPKTKNKLPYPAWVPLFAWGISIFVIFTLWLGNLKPLFASQNSINGQKYLAERNQSDETLKMALEKFKDSLNSNSFTNPETKKIFPRLIISAVNSPYYSPQLKLEALKFTAQELEKGAKEMPYFFDNNLNLADVYNALSMENRYYLSDGEKTMRKTVETYPNVPYLYYKLIVSRILTEDYPSAITAGQKAVQLNPNLEESHWYLGLAYFYASDFKQAKESTDKAIALGHSYNNLNNLFQLAQLYGKLKDYDKAISFYQKVLELNPQEFQVKLELAKTYKDAGQKEKASALAQQLLASSTPQTASMVKEFIDSIK